MNWNTPAVFGGNIPDLTPTIDRLAGEGIRFENAYVQAPNCSPSRVVIQTGLYPHQSGMRGFYYVQDNVNTLPEILKENGYYTGVLNKKADTSLSPYFEMYWDESSSIPGGEKRSARKYKDIMGNFLKRVSRKDKPFYCVVNIADPHKPFFNDDKSKKKGFDKFKPSKIYNYDDVKVPEFLPDTPLIKQQVLNYVNSVKRGDDCIAEVLKVLEASEFADNTIIILLSDHGMPFPYAKSTIYQNGVKTPMIVKWPGKIEKASVNKEDMVSAVDLAPTILEITNIKSQNIFEGHSFYNSLFNKNETPNNFVFAQYDENAGGVPRPSRTVISNRFGYVFNPWATGNYKFISAATHQKTYKQMRRLSDTDENIKKRFDFWIHRSVEELYDYKNDPNALNNLIDDPKYKDIVSQLREELSKHMKKTKDYVLEAFENKEDKAFLNSWMEKELENARLRRETIRWKRYKNKSGPTKNNKQLYKVSFLD
jgi:N-sulfoglucosamine sulfohydrolase